MAQNVVYIYPPLLMNNAYSSVVFVMKWEVETVQLAKCGVSGY
jgi:hypothetical protein